MKSATTIGIDLAKNSFSVYGVDDKGKTVLSRTLPRAGVVRFFANLPSCLVGMEACASSDYWARTIESLGHEVRRIHGYIRAAPHREAHVAYRESGRVVYAVAHERHALAALF